MMNPYCVRGQYFSNMYVTRKKIKGHKIVLKSHSYSYLANGSTMHYFEVIHLKPLL